MNSLLSAVVNGMVVGAGLALVVWIALWVMPARLLNAATRYAIWWAVMLAVVILPLAYVPFDAAKAVVVRQRGGFGAARLFTPQNRSMPVAPPAAPLRSAPRPSVVLPAARPRVVSRPFFPLVIAAGVWSARLVWFWVVLAGFMVLRLLVSVAMLERRKQRAEAAPPVLAQRILEWLRWRRSVRVLCSSEIPIPVAAGPWRPSILLPSQLVERLSADELAHIGIHEAGHLVRRDDYALLLQRVLEAMFVLHPVVWFVSRRIDLEREIACDDLVVEATGNAQPYAACLARVVELSGAVQALPVAAAAVQDRSHLAARVAMLLDSSRNHGTGLSKLRLVVALVCLAGISWGAVQGRKFVAFTKGPVQVMKVVEQTPVVMRPQIRLLAQATAPNVPAPAAAASTSPVSSLPADYLQRQQQTLYAMETLRENLEKQRQDSAAVMVDFWNSLNKANKADELELQQLQRQLQNLMNQAAVLDQAAMDAKQRDKQQQLDDAMARLEELAKRQQELAGQSKDLRPTELPREKYNQEMLRHEAEQLRQVVQALGNAQYGVGPAQVAPTAASRLVYIPVEVRDGQDRFVTGLDKNVFHVKEDGVEQSVTQLLADDAPTAIFLMTDSHRPAGLDFSQVKGVVIPFEADGSKISGAMQMIGQAARAYPGGRKVAIVVAGSSANTQSYTQAELRDALQSLSMPTYIFEVPDYAPAGQAGILAEIGSRSGGRFVSMTFADGLSDAINKALIGVRNQYVIGYSPTNAARDGGYRNVEVTIDPPRGLPPLTAHSPGGYYAAAQ